MQDMQRFDVRLISYGWRNQFNWMPLLSIDETDEEIYLYWEFPNDEEALLFKLTHM
jgi:hypothetical protein